MAASMAGTTFHVAVEKILNSWAVLQLAVQHGFGGADSEGKARWLVDALVQWFQENKGLETYEVEDFLADILDTEFNTIADDGSLSVVSQGICECFDLCSQGDEAGVMERLARLPKPDLGRCRGSTEDAEDETEDQNDEMECAAQPPTLVPINHTQSGATNSEENSSETGVEKMEEEDDGWMTVTTKKGKRR